MEELRDQGGIWGRSSYRSFSLEQRMTEWTLWINESSWAGWREPDRPETKVTSFIFNSFFPPLPLFVSFPPKKESHFGITHQFLCCVLNVMIIGELI